MSAVGGSGSAVRFSRTAVSGAGIRGGHHIVLSPVRDARTAVGRSFAPVVQAVEFAVEFSVLSGRHTHLFLEHPDEVVAAAKIKGCRQFLDGHPAVLYQQKSAA